MMLAQMYIERLAVITYAILLYPVAWYGEAARTRGWRY
jgi:hypothetical protein